MQVQRNVAFGRRLKECRKARDFTQEDLARLVGCAAETIRKIEAGVLRPSKQIAERLADTLAIPAEERDAFVCLARATLSAESAAPIPIMDGVPRAAAPVLNEGATGALKNPYKGLRPFQEADAADFFGREALTQHLLARLAEPSDHARFLAVVGPSGSGKSSVVRAGLIPALRRGALPGSETWPVVQLLPGTHPLEELEAALLRVMDNPPASLLQQLQEDERGLLRAVKRALPSGGEAGLVLVIDQFEELFTLVADESTRLHVLNSLCAALADPRCGLRVIITLRADFYDRPLLYAGFGELVRQRTEVVLPLAPEELRRAIVNPAGRAGVALEAPLIAAIMNDVAEQPGALPLLQYALTELFERRSGRTLTLDAYTTSGGVLGALARRAEEIYAGLDEREQEAARQLFLRLVTPDEGGDDTRRRVPLAELTSARPDRAAIETAINGYGAYRLLTFDRDPITGGPTVEVAHEALIRVWERLRQWLDVSCESVRLQRRLAAAAAEWVGAGRDASFLAVGARLELFAAWASETNLALNQQEQLYLDASLAEQRTQRQRAAASSAHEAALERRSRNVLRALVVVLLLAVLGAFVPMGVALEQSSSARRNAAEAQNQALAAGAQAALHEGNVDLALSLALVANRMPDPVALAQLTLTDAAYPPGTRRRFAGHEGGVQDVALSPDGRYALSGSDDKTLILWDLATGQPVRRFAGHAGSVRSVAFSPDGRSALSGSDDQTLILWDLASGRELRRFKKHTNAVQSVAFSPDGSRALSGSEDRTLVLWDVATGRALSTFTGHAGKIKAVAFSPDGRSVLSGSDDQTLILWDVASGRALRTFAGHTGGVNAVAFSPDGRTALSGADDQTMILWDVATGQVVLRFVGHTGEVKVVAFSPDGRSALSGSQDTSLRLWDLATGKQVGSLIGHSSTVNGAVFTPDGRAVLSGAMDRSLRLWDLDNGAEIRRLMGHTDGVEGLALSSDGRMALSGSDDKMMILWDVAGGRAIRRFTGHTSKVYGVAFSPDGRSALSGSGDKTLILWDLASGAPIRRLIGHTNWVVSVAFSPDGRTALSGSTDHTLILWNLATGQVVRRFQGHEGSVQSVAFSPDGRSALSGSSDEILILWDLTTGHELRRFVGHTGPVRDAAFSPDGRTALSGADDQTLILWDLATGRALRRFVGHRGAVFGVAFSPDGRSALSGSSDASVIVWDVASGQAIRRFAGHTAPVRDVVFSPDGHSALSGSVDGSLRVWRIDSLAELIAWTSANRYVPELICDQRKLYRLDPTCDSTITPALR